MSLLQGKFDPAQLNSVTISIQLREIIVNMIDRDGELNFLDVSQSLLDNLVSQKILE